VHPCHEKTATFDPEGKEYWWFFTSSVPNISAKPDTSCKTQNSLDMNRNNCYMSMKITDTSVNSSKINTWKTINTIFLLENFTVMIMPD